ncbi:hypothetical protein PBI_MRMAGOO_85 [Mycobacterium phage MrMagoo]|uniref:Uncharacterized protein n=1 Tax=Mycobacterium phage MrMagoo TaxID=1927020 RepID=A0A1L6BYL7_9CAUD|nr:hypothetical protein J4U04_gp085 [Mycobacterium phage MrMagoo]APQ42188.1 hypothetical protein PBI_MRMAGOO_85 [Mycobacterium phage MrMagoo]ARM70263.1 hypothetical protein SEA_GARDENSALSA_85 [Mycobacterium phage GardenSalsa]
MTEQELKERVLKLRLDLVAAEAELDEFQKSDAHFPEHTILIEKTTDTLPVVLVRTRQYRDGHGHTVAGKGSAWIAIHKDGSHTFYETRDDFVANQGGPGMFEEVYRP